MGRHSVIPLSWRNNCLNTRWCQNSSWQNICNFHNKYLLVSILKAREKTHSPLGGYLDFVLYLWHFPTSHIFVLLSNACFCVSLLFFISYWFLLNKLCNYFKIICDWHEEMYDIISKHIPNGIVTHIWQIREWPATKMRPSLAWLTPHDVKEMSNPRHYEIRYVQ